MKAPKIFIVAGEVSGDIHASYLLRRLQHYMPNVEVQAMGGPRLREAGAEVLFDVTHRSTIGFAEVFRHLFPILYTFRNLKAAIAKFQPDLLLLVDYQGFNMTLAKAVRQAKVPVFYYIAPQEWIWGTPEGARQVALNTDRIFTIFKSEDVFYRSSSTKVEYIGHPLLDIVKASDPETFRSKHGITVKDKVVALFPGSRTQEIKCLLPLLLQTAALLKQVVPEVKFFLPVSAGIFRTQIAASVASASIPVTIVPFENRYELMASAHAALATSGTVTLELSIMEVPTVITYAISALSYWFAKNILRIKIRHVGLPNIVADMQIVPEFIQKRAQAPALAAELRDLLQDPVRCERMKSNQKTVKRKLGEPGAIDRAAFSIYTFLVS